MREVPSVRAATQATGVARRPLLFSPRIFLVPDDGLGPVPASIQTRLVCKLLLHWTSAMEFLLAFLKLRSPNAGRTSGSVVEFQAGAGGRARSECARGKLRAGGDWIVKL